MFALTQDWIDKNFSYKPGWRFKVFANSVRTDLQVTAILSDSRTQINSTVGIPEPFLPKAEISVTFPFFSGEFETEDHFLAWIRDNLGIMEHHERDEWIQVRGELPFDPHVNGNMELRRA